MNLKKYLDNLVDKRFLKKEKIGLDQVMALLESAKKNLRAAHSNMEIDEEVCYTMAYMGMLKVGRAIFTLRDIGLLVDISTKRLLMLPV